MYGETLDSQMSASVMVPQNARSENQFFAVNSPQILFRATVANAVTGSLKSLHTLLDTYLDNMLSKFEPNRMTQNVTKLSFWTRKEFFKTIFDKALTPFCKSFLVLKQLFNGEL